MIRLMPVASASHELGLNICSNVLLPSSCLISRFKTSTR